MSNDASQHDAGLCVARFYLTPNFNPRPIPDSSANRRPCHRDARRDNRAFQDKLHRGDPVAVCREPSSRAGRDRDGLAVVAAKHESAAVIRSRPGPQLEAAKGTRQATSRDDRRLTYRHRYSNPQVDRGSSVVMDRPVDRRVE